MEIHMESHEKLKIDLSYDCYITLLVYIGKSVNQSTKEILIHQYY
jgi:hypothetical protein